MSIRKISKIRRNDPCYEREAAKYQFPLPSREYVLQTLTNKGAPVSFSLLCSLLDVRQEEYELFKRRLAAMERSGELLQNRKGNFVIPERVNLISGRVEGHADGYGFLIPDDHSEDIYLDARQMAGLLHKDKALVRISGSARDGRREGVVVEVLERANTRVVGRVVVEHGVALVVPENKKIAQDILLAADQKRQKSKPKEVITPKSGQVVVVEIIQQPSAHTQPLGKIVEVLGNYADPGMEIEIALRKHELPFEFPAAISGELEALPSKVKKSECKGRVDLRDLPLVTIDGETAKDFDDAVYAEKKGRGWRLIVAIADVSHYVRPGSALDAEAYARGNSVYFPRRVIPMLPEALSNELCSLNPEVDRLSLVCDMQINAKGDIKDYRFYPAVFRSHARLTYNLVWSWLNGEQVPKKKKQLTLLPMLQELFALFSQLLKARHRRGAIDFETTETMMSFDEHGKIASIFPVHRNDAHRIIEECMLAANVCASDFLEKNKQPCLYRIHEGPTPEKLNTLRTFLKEFGLDLPGGEDPTAKDYAQLLDSIKQRPDVELLQTAMLRSLRQAVYSPDNLGHFGLAYEHYTHFTSPIRRYPDLLVHRAIKSVLEGRQYAPGDWDEIGAHCSMTERRADDATRDVDSWLKCYYMQDRINEEFNGSIAGVAPFGVFVALDEVYVEGLVHVSELGEDYFIYDNLKHQMRGERTGARFRLGDRLRVRLVRANLDNGRIDFVLVARLNSTGEEVAKPVLSGGARIVKKKTTRGSSQRRK